MPHYIKTGYWALEKNGYKGWLNLEDIMSGGGSSAVNVTKAEVDALITANGLVPGQTYVISGVDVPLYGGTTVILQADTTNKLALAGHGVFYNPKYLNSQSTPNNGYGIWSTYMNVTMTNIVGSFSFGDTVTANNGATAIYRTNGFLSWISGDWGSATSITGAGGGTADIFGAISPSYSIGQDVIWGGKHWTNTSGNVGTSIDDYTLSSYDWTVVPFNSTDYNVVADIIHYDYEHDLIVRRKDKWNNDVLFDFMYYTDSSASPIKKFQWGNYSEDYNTNDEQRIGVFNNYVNHSYIYCINFIGRAISANILNNDSYIDYIFSDTSSGITNNTLTASGINYSTLVSSFIGNNILTTNSSITYNSLVSSNINGNTLSNLSIMQDNIIDNSNIYNNRLIDNSNINNNTIYSSNISNNTIDNNGRIQYNQLSDFSNIIGNDLFNSRIGGEDDEGDIIDINILNDSNISSNILISGRIYGNSLSLNSVIIANTINGSIINGNSITSSTLGSNTLINSSSIDGNVLSATSYLQKNILNNSSNISNNSLSNVVYLTNNILDNNSSINTNVQTNTTYIVGNKMTAASLIKNNTLSNSNAISYNELNTSFIHYNTATGAGGVSRNILNNSEFQLLSSGTLTSKSISNITANSASLAIDISSATIIYGNYSKQLFSRQDGTTKLGYYNNSDVFTIVNVNA